MIIFGWLDSILLLLLIIAIEVYKVSLRLQLHFIIILIFLSREILWRAHASIVLIVHPLNIFKWVGGDIFAPSTTLVTLLKVVI